MSLVLVFLVLASSLIGAFAVDPWINEFHYRPKDNMFVEVAGPANQPADDVKIVFYQGRTGTMYNSIINMTGMHFDQGVDANSGIGFKAVPVSFMRKGNQKGDGIALSTTSKPCLLFISYGGSFTAGNGVCQGVTSMDVGVKEPKHAVAGKSIQLKGTGNTFADFTWWSQPKNMSPGAANQGQNLQATHRKLSVTMNHLRKSISHD